MWKQKMEDPQLSRTAPAPDPLRPVLTRHADAPAPSRPVPPNATHSCIGRGITVRGDISGSDTLSIDGTVEGMVSIPGERVTVGRDGRVSAPDSAGAAPCICAREIVIVGTVKGTIEAEDRVEIRAQASLTGDVSTRRVSIEDGAYFRGGIDIRRDQASVEPAAAAPTVAESAATTPARDPVPA